MALDPELGRIPLDGRRPPPSVFAQQNLYNRGRIAISTATKAANKIRQRFGQTQRSFAGSELLAHKVVQHWRTNPDILNPVREMNVINVAWLEDVLAMRTSAPPASVALILNLDAAGRALVQQRIKHPLNRVTLTEHRPD